MCKCDIDYLTKFLFYQLHAQNHLNKFSLYKDVTRSDWINPLIPLFTHANLLICLIKQ